MAKLIKLNVPRETKVGWLDDFGKSRDYYLLLALSDQAPLQFADTLTHLFHRDFVFLENHSPIADQPDKVFPVFDACLNSLGDVRMLFMPNKVSEANDDQAIRFPLLGFSMFEEDFYLFNKQGSRLFPCDYADYDYLLLLSCNRGVDVSDVLDVLAGEARLSVRDISGLLGEESSEEARTFLKTMCVALGISLRERVRDTLQSRLGPVKSIPDANYFFSFLRPDQVPESPLLVREDV